MRFVVFGLILISCSSLENGDVDDAKNFEVVEISSNGVEIVNSYYSGEGAAYIAKGKVKNLSNRTLDNYYLRIGYRLFNEAGEGYELQYDRNLFPTDGFSRSIKEGKAPWAPGEVIEFKIDDHILSNEIRYPIARAQVLYRIVARDPFGHEFDEYVESYDVTTSWKDCQTKIAASATQ
jgi:hypothetical protein